MIVRRPRFSPNLLDGLFLGMAPRVIGFVLGVGLTCGLVGALFLFVLHVLQNVLWPTHWSGAVGFANSRGRRTLCGARDPLRGKSG